MGYLRRPSYYRRFHCIASACTDTCCAGWEIDVDDETLEKYRKMQGPFAERLKREIVLPEDAESGEPAHFRLKADDRCPFLNEENLCDIYIRLGSDYLSYICTHHPRFYEWYPEGQEAGLGLVCEAAAELILEKTGVPEFEELSDGEDSGPAAEHCGDEDGAEPEDFSADRLLFAAREQMFRIIKSEGSLDEKVDHLYAFAEQAQAEYEDALYSGAADEEDMSGVRADMQDDMPTISADVGDAFAGTTGNTPAQPGAWSCFFWTESFLNHLLSTCRGLEINDPAWWELLGRMQNRLPELLSRRGAFCAYYKEKLYEYEQLLIYFLYRYFMKARLDGEVTERVAFALLSAGIIELADILCWLETGGLSHREQIDICKMYAKEIEYDEENVDALSHFCNQEPVGHV